MARAASEKYRTGFEGILLAPVGYLEDVPGFEGFEGTHPVPSDTNVAVTKKIAGKVKALGEGDMLLALISGGTSALLCLPKEGVTLKEKIETTRELLKSGVEMAELNTIRKSLSAVKGGKLADMAHPGAVETLITSDVAGDDPMIIGSAPTGGGNIVLKADDMLAVIAEKAESMGLRVTNLGGTVTAEAKVLAGAHAKLALETGEHPHLILSGGETSVSVTGKGHGGRNSEYALALALALDGAEGVYAIAIDTDGHDGTGPHAGAWVRPDTLARAKEKEINPEKFLKNNDSGGFFKMLGDSIITGPTFTNLNDLRMILAA